MAKATAKYLKSMKSPTKIERKKLAEYYYKRGWFYEWMTEFYPKSDWMR